MTRFYTNMFACVAFSAMALPAQATLVEFDFRADGPISTVTTVSRDFSVGDLDLHITASTLDENGDIIPDADARIGQYGQYGLGITNKDDNYWWGWDTFPLGIDGEDGSDRLNLDFSQDVKLVSAEFYFYGSNRDFNPSDDPSTDPNDTGDIDQLEPIEMSFSFDNLGNHTFTELLVGDLFGIGAGDTIESTSTGSYWVCSRSRHHHGRKCKEIEYDITSYIYSSFKLKSLTVQLLEDDTDETTTVPLPASLPLFGSGLAVMGYLGMRRRKKAKAA